MLSHYEPSIEELDRATVAKEFLEAGVRLPLLDYQTDAYGAGCLLATGYTVPFLALFGKSLFVVKLVPFCWHILTLIVWYFIWARAFSPAKSFCILFLFFVLPPPRIAEYLLVNVGYHIEMLLWLGLSILLFRKVLDGSLKEVWGGFLLGLLGGFSSWMHLSNGLTVAVIWIYLWGLASPPPVAKPLEPPPQRPSGFLLGVRPNTIRRPLFFFFYFAGFVPGFFPWIYSNGYHHWEGLQFLGRLFTEGQHFVGFLKNTLRDPEGGLRGLFAFRGYASLLGNLPGIIYSLIYAASLAFLAWRKRKILKGFDPRFDVLAFGLVFQLLLLALYMFCNTANQEHYLFPMVLFAGQTLFFGGEALAEAMRGLWKRRMALFLFSLAAAANFLGNLGLVQWDRLGSTLRIPGYNYRAWLWLDIFTSRFSGDLSAFREKLEKVMAGRPPEVRREFYQGLTFEFFKIETQGDVEDLFAFVRGADEESRGLLTEKLLERISTLSLEKK